MRKNLWIVAVVVGIAFVGTGTASLVFADKEEHGHGAKGKEVTLTGEVVDLHCYMLHPDDGVGEKHAKCAKGCIGKGLPAGFLSDGQVYLLLGPGHDSVKDLVGEHAGHPVSLTGTLVEHSGIKAIQVSKVGGAAGGKGSKGDGHEGHEH